MDTTGNICLTVWQIHIDKGTENQWYQITGVTIKNYYGIKLPTIPKSVNEGITLEERLNWEHLNVQGYLEHELSARTKTPSVQTISVKTRSKSRMVIKLLNGCLVEEEYYSARAEQVLKAT